MATFNTVEELIEILDADPQLLEALRARILTRELLELPAAHGALVAEVREFAAATNRRFDALEIKVDGLTDQMGRVITDMGDLKGRALESELWSRGMSRVASLFKMRNMRVIRMAEQDANSAEFNDAIAEAEDNNILSEEEYDRLLRTDLIVLGRERGTPKDVYAAIEASYTLGRSDIERAKQSVSAIRKVFPNAEVRPVVFCSNITDTFSQMAESEGVSVLMSSRRWQVEEQET